MSCVTCPCWRWGDLRISWNVSAHPLKDLSLFPRRRSSTLFFILNMPEIDLGSWVLVTPAWGRCFCPVTSSHLDISYNPPRDTVPVVWRVGHASETLVLRIRIWNGEKSLQGAKTPFLCWQDFLKASKQKLLPSLIFQGRAFNICLPSPILCPSNSLTMRNSFFLINLYLIKANFYFFIHPPQVFWPLEKRG